MVEDRCPTCGNRDFIVDGYYCICPICGTIIGYADSAWDYKPSLRQVLRRQQAAEQPPSTYPQHSRRFIGLAPADVHPILQRVNAPCRPVNEAIARALSSELASKAKVVLYSRAESMRCSLYGMALFYCPSDSVVRRARSCSSRDFMRGFKLAVLLALYGVYDGSPFAPLAQQVMSNSEQFVRSLRAILVKKRLRITPYLVGQAMSVCGRNLTCIMRNLMEV